MRVDSRFLRMGSGQWAVGSKKKTKTYCSFFWLLFFIFCLGFSANCLLPTAYCSEQIRKPVVAGSFYPANKEELTEMIEVFLGNVKTTVDAKEDIFAVIVPHAGYVYSGQVAAYSYKQLKDREVKTVVIICNSHSSSFSGIAIDDFDAWQTPLGLVKVDKKLAEKLVYSSEEIQFNKSVHQWDHTIETQIPFLQRVLKTDFKRDFKIVPILFGNTKDDSYKALAQALVYHLGKDDLLVISTDLSHYPKYEDANNIDHGFLQLIKKRDIIGLENYVSHTLASNVPGEQTLSCGIDGIKTLLEICNIKGYGDIEILKYANSGDVRIGDKKRVVGYGSVVFKKGEAEMTEEYLNKDEKKKLLEIARLSIIEAVTGKKQFYPNVTESRLKENCGAFVTINKNAKLRGCIGYIIAVKPLHETVRDVAKSAAVNDFRFSPVTEKELDELEIEISALTPLKRINDIKEIEVGKHGLYMKRGVKSGLLLPQVAIDYGWDKETFLQHTCQKAGLPINAWQDASTEIYVFSADVFGEHDIQ